MPRTAPAARPPHVRTHTPILLTLTADQCRTALAALVDVARRERETAAELYRPGQLAAAEALQEKELFADECERIGNTIRVALENRS